MAVPRSGDDGRPGLAAPGPERQPRGEQRGQAILSAVIGLLGEAGYEALTMDAVAARAHASKATIYRRWPGKAELVRAAVDAHIAGRVPGAHDTGSLRGDLLAVLQAMRSHLTPEFMAMMGGLVHAMRADPDLAGSLWSLVDQDRVAEEVIGRAVRRGELPAPGAARLASLVHEVIEAQIFRQLMTAADLDSGFARHVVDDIILPLLAGSTGRPGPRDETTGAAPVSLTAFSAGELQRFTQAFEELFYAADPASMTSYYTEEAKLMAEGMEPIQGHAAITEFWRAAITRAAATGARRTIRLHESHCSGDLGYALCTVTVDIPPASDAAGRGGTSVAVWDATIWQRGPGGGWRIAVDISTALPPATA